MSQQCEEQQFLKHVEAHEMEIIRNDGVNRHLRFAMPGTRCYSFDLITWPGHLCITGDCGTYVFSRVEDMFKFFRIDPDYAKRYPGRKLQINAGYWCEKLISIGTSAGYKEFDEESFKERVVEHFRCWQEGSEPSEEQAAELWAEIESSVLSQVCDGEHFAYHAVYTFEHEGFRFDDFFDGGGTEQYTFSYLWCLYAIVWGIQQFDQAEIIQGVNDCTTDHDCIKNKLLKWFATGRVGVSSQAMACAAAGLPQDRSWGNHPYDAGDLNRCLMLLDAVPEVRNHFDQIAMLSSEWKNLIANWSAIEAAFIEEVGLNFSKGDRAKKAYNLMQQALKVA